jgi:hypothetical protein
MHALRLEARRAAAALVLAGVLALPGCSGCSKSDGPSAAVVSSAGTTMATPAGSAAVVAESLPRCRLDGARVVVPGDDVVVGEAVVAPDALLVGVVRREGTKRLASIVRTSLDLANMKMIEVGPALGEDPPPAPRMRGATAFVTSFARRAAPDAGTDAGAGAMGATRLLTIARLDPSGLVMDGAIAQQADESLAYDVAWPEGDTGAGIVAWDEDAAPAVAQALGDRGVIKVQLLGAGTKAHVASPEKSDAEAPRLLARPGGYWLAWLARRAEAAEDAGTLEGPGERRAYRWVELVALDGKGEPTSAVRRVSPANGRVASFDLVRAGAPGDARLVVLVQDEAAHAEGTGERIAAYAIEGEKIEAAELLDGGVGHALADLLPQAGGNRWLAFMDTQEHAHLMPLGPTLRVAGPNTSEPALDGARVLGAAPPDVLYAVGPAGAADASGTRIELRRLICH